MVSGWIQLKTIAKPIQKKRFGTQKWFTSCSNHHCLTKPNSIFTTLKNISNNKQNVPCTLTALGTLQRQGHFTAPKALLQRAIYPWAGGDGGFGGAQFGLHFPVCALFPNTFLESSWMESVRHNSGLSHLCPKSPEISLFATNYFKHP